MFRVADIRRRTAMAPRVRAVLYLWSPQAHATAEGEPVGVTAQELTLTGGDPSLLIPAVWEHTVDERSPLYGHTHETLEACGAEVVVTFEGVNELGHTFTARQSYLATEIHWGHTFAPVIVRAVPPLTRHTVNLARFHEVERQRGFRPELPPERLSRAVAAGAPRFRALPGASLKENTLALADDLVVAPRGGGWALMVRLGDTYPSQMVDVEARVFLYRYAGGSTPEGEEVPFTVQELRLAEPRVMLRYPATLRHDIADDSPIRGWAAPDGVLEVNALAWGCGRLLGAWRAVFDGMGALLSEHLNKLTSTTKTKPKPNQSTIKKRTPTPRLW
jgi:hypothetical protein